MLNNDEHDKIRGLTIDHMISFRVKLLIKYRFLSNSLSLIISNDKPLYTLSNYIPNILENISNKTCFLYRSQ